VLSDSQINPDTVSSYGCPVEPGITNGFVRTVDCDRSGTSSATEVFFLLISQLVEIADPGEHMSDIASLVVDDSGSTGEQILAKLRQIITVRRRDADSCDDDTVLNSQDGASPTRNADNL
jgi:hypothetical protein